MIEMVQPIPSPTALPLPQPVKTLHLQSTEAALFFVQTTSVRHLFPFMGREASLAEAAERIGISKSHMSYWLRKMLRLGVIEQTRIVRRGKHNVPLYRATAEAFTVPTDQVPVATDEEILNLNSRTFEAMERRSIVRSSSNNNPGWLLRLSFDERLPRLQMLPPSGMVEDSEVLNKWGCLALTKSQAKALRGEIMELLERYASQETFEGRDHLYKFLLVEARLD
jgi:DNA-binding transcriptional ArsR family regulator